MSKMIASGRLHLSKWKAKKVAQKNGVDQDDGQNDDDDSQAVSSNGTVSAAKRAGVKRAVKWD